ncbi:MAG TPA: D-alanyl-D-alanine carboxypeptidase [Clostridiales bacterium]|nr:D-alanyl-D-alanine carboxypeptidase [Clostridiales bacterium]
MKNFFPLLIIFMLMISNVNTIYVQATTDKTYSTMWCENFPNICAESAIIMEAETGSILYGKNMHDKNFPASITKILTTLIALENSSMNETVTFSKDAVFEVDLDSSRIGIDVNEQLTMEQALYGIMLASANEVSYAVAEHVAGDIPSFTKLMNEKAKEVGALNSNFTNPHGLPDSNHYTTAYDMALISKASLANEDFCEISQTRTYTIPPTNIQEESRPLANHHKFINRNIHFEGAIGGKTGWTSVSRHTLVTFAKRDGMTLIAVVMNCPSSNDVYTDTSNLLNYAFDNFKSNTINEANVDMSENIDFFAKYHSFFNLSNSPLQVSENGKVILPNDVNFNETQRTIDLAPLETLNKGENIIGSIIYSYNDTNLGRTDIIYNNSDSEALSESLYLTPAKVIAKEPNKQNVNNTIKEEETENSINPIVIGVGVGLIVMILGFASIYFFNPYRKHKIRFKNKNLR